MEPLRTLTVAGLRRDKATFMGLAVLLFLSALALTLTVSLFVDLSEREETLLDEVGAGDVFANDLPTNLDEATINEIRDLLEVEEVKVTDSFAAPTRFVGASGEELREKSMASSTAFEPWSEALSFNVFDDDLSSYREDAAGPKDGEVYVRPALKTLYGLEVGDAILVSTGDEEAELKVAGFYEDPQLGSPFLETTRFLVSDGTFDQLHAKAVESYSLAGSDAGAGMMSLQDTSYPLTEINVYLTPETKASGMTGRDLAQIIGDETAWGKTTNALFARETMAGYTLLVVQVISAILCAFSLLLFVVALVLCLHMASASIESDYANWGILKAVGANRKMLRRALIAQYASCAFFGLLLGFVIGYGIEPLLWSPFALLTGILVQAPAFPWAAFAFCALLFAALVCSIALKARRIAAITPLSALRQGDGDVRFSPRGTSAISGSHLKTSLACRAVVSQKGRYVGVAVCSLLLCAFIALCFGIGGAVAQDSAVYRTFGVWKSDASVELMSGDVTETEVRDVIEEVTPITRVWQEGATMLNMNGESRTFVGLSDMDVVDDETLMAGRKPTLPNEALVGLSMARSAGLDVGDEFEVLDQQKDGHRYIVSGIISSVLNGGNGILLTYEGVEELAGDDLAGAESSYQFQLADPRKADEATALLRSRFGDGVSTEPTGLFGSSTNMILLIRDLLTGVGYAMAAFAVLLACVAAILVSRRMLISEQRDLGVYRALGFPVCALRISFALRFLGVALLGAFIGVALTTVFGSFLIGALFSLFGVGRLTLSLPPWEALVIAGGFACVFAGAAYVFSLGIKRVSVRILVTE